MPTLSDVLAPPRLLEITLGEHTFSVSEIPLADAALLERWVATEFPSPIEATREELKKFKSEIDKTAFLRIIAESFEAPAWPPVFGTVEFWRPIAYTTKGKAKLISIALKERYPEISGSDQACWTLALASSREQMNALTDAIHGREYKPDPKHPADQADPQNLIGESLLAAFLSFMIPKLSAGSGLGNLSN